jgi:hypothetical protein
VNLIREIYIYVIVLTRACFSVLIMPAYPTSPYEESTVKWTTLVGLYEMNKKE